MNTVIWIGIVAVLAVIATAWLVIVISEIRDLTGAASASAQPERPGPNEWIDARLNTETHPGRRMALLMIRDDKTGEES